MTSSFERVGVRRAVAMPCDSIIAVGSACITNSDGAPQPMNFSLAGTAFVQAGRLYLIELGLGLSTFNNAGSFGLQTADFFDSAAFSFTDLGGVSFTSSSGLFLSAVPEQQVWMLWAVGLAGVTALVRRQQRAAIAG